jgi:hypothetical protein
MFKKNKETDGDCSRGLWNVQRWWKPGNLGGLFPIFGLFLHDFGDRVCTGLDD